MEKKNKKNATKINKNTRTQHQANLVSRADDSFVQSDERYKSLFNRSLDMIYLHDLKGRFLDANDAALNRLGYTKEEISSLNFASFLSNDQLPLALKSMENILAGTQKTLTEYRLRHKDGSDVYVETRGTVVMSNGKPMAIQAIARDITERKKAEEALKEAELKLRTIFDSASDGILVAQRDNKKFSTANKKICRMLGYTEKELLKLSIYDIHPKKSWSHVINQFEKQIKEEILVAKDIPVLKKDGTMFFSDVSSSPIIINGKECLLGMFRDITERKRNEEALKEREEELSAKSRNLEEMNAALKVLLKQREEDRMQIEENVLINVKMSIFPYVEKLKKGALTKHQKNCLKMIEKQMKEIVAPFLRAISQSSFNLTPQELRVADLVKNGNTTKEIAGMLRISMKTVDYHRDNLRRKLGIKNNKTNLRSFLLKFS